MSASASGSLSLVYGLRGSPWLIVMTGTPDIIHDHLLGCVWVHPRFVISIWRRVLSVWTPLLSFIVGPLILVLPLWLLSRWTTICWWFVRFSIMFRLGRCFDSVFLTFNCWGHALPLTRWPYGALSLVDAPTAHFVSDLWCLVSELACPSHFVWIWFYLIRVTLLSTYNVSSFSYWSLGHFLVEFCILSFSIFLCWLHELFVMRC